MKTPPSPHIIKQSRNPWIRTLLLFIALLFIIPCQSLGTGQKRILQTKDVIIHFEYPMERVAKQVAILCSQMKSELRDVLGWELSFRPVVLLIRHRKTFQKMAGSDFFVAFAVPRKQLIVMDCSRMKGNPFTLGITLKHELCHLLLHHHIKNPRPPKWLDEGVAQWVSDGMSELIMDRKRSVLDEVVLTGNYIRLDALTHEFPRDKISLTLAYEESKSVVEHMEHEFGESGILAVLNRMRQGDGAEDAIQKELSISFDDLEKGWRLHLRQRKTWFVYLATHVYDILFFIGALTAVFGFMRLMIKKRAYKDEDEDEDGEEQAL